MFLFLELYIIEEIGGRDYDIFEVDLKGFSIKKMDYLKIGAEALPEFLTFGKSSYFYKDLVREIEYRILNESVVV